MIAKSVAPIVFVAVVLLALVFVFAAVGMDLTPSIPITGQPDAVLGIRDYCGCARWEPLVTSVKPGSFGRGTSFSSGCLAQQFQAGPDTAPAGGIAGTLRWSACE
jgi:hypothetical protein